VYLKGRENLETFVKNGWIQEEKEPLVYIYSQKMGEFLQFGIMLEASIEVTLKKLNVIGKKYLLIFKKFIGI